MNLYELSEMYVNLQEMLEDDTQDHETIMDTLDSIQEDVETKIDSIIKLIRNTEAEINALKAEEARLNARRKAKEKSEKKLREFIIMIMNTVGIQKVKGLAGTVSLGKEKYKYVVQDEMSLKVRFPEFVEMVPKVINKNELNKQLSELDEDQLRILGVVVEKNRTLSIR